jgi:hypothetical protein
MGLQYRDQLTPSPKILGHMSERERVTHRSQIHNELVQPLHPARAASILAQPRRASPRYDREKKASVGRPCVDARLVAGAWVVGHAPRRIGVSSIMTFTYNLSHRVNLHREHMNDRTVVNYCTVL